MVEEIKPYILIYQDYIGNNFPLYRSLCDLYGRAAVGWCTADDILAGRLDPAVKLFVMPGGEDRYYFEKLKGEGNRRIREFVERGGRYLGICAGAYYACERIEWAAGTAHEICEARELGFFPGTAVGPIGGAEALDTIGDPRPSIVEVSFEKDGISHDMKAIYHGGPVFVLGDGAKADHQALTRWSGSWAGSFGSHEPTAVLMVRVGKGRAVLSALHPEIGARDLDLYAYEANATSGILGSIAHDLKTEEAGRMALWCHIHDALDVGAPAL